MSILDMLGGFVVGIKKAKDEIVCVKKEEKNY